MITNVFKFFQLRIKSSDDGKEHLCLFTGNWYEIPTKEDLIHLKECLENSITNYDNVISYMDRENKSLEADYRYEPPCNKKEKKITPGIIYVAKCERTNLFKIGMTRGKISDRMKTLKTSNPSITLFSEFKVDNILCEAYLHSVFAMFRVDGEWFELTDTQLNTIEQHITDFGHE